MTEEKNADFNPETKSETEFNTSKDNSSSSTRARNRTVMLTPDITGQVRAMLQGEISQDVVKGLPGMSQNAPVSESVVNPNVGNEYVSSTYFPAAEAKATAAKSQPKVIETPKKPENIGGYFHPASTRQTPIVGFLVSYDQDPNGEIFELRTGRWIVSSEQTSSGNYILLNDQSVSPLHAIMRVSSSAEIQVLDQLSEFGTGIKKFGSNDEELLTGSMGSVEHGDILRFGERTFHICLIPLSTGA